MSNTPNPAQKQDITIWLIGLIYGHSTKVISILAIIIIAAIGMVAIKHGHLRSRQEFSANLFLAQQYAESGEASRAINILQELFNNEEAPTRVTLSGLMLVKLLNDAQNYQTSAKIIQIILNLPLKKGSWLHGLAYVSIYRELQQMPANLTQGFATEVQQQIEATHSRASSVLRNPYSTSQEVTPQDVFFAKRINELQIAQTTSEVFTGQQGLSSKQPSPQLSELHQYLQTVTTNPKPSENLTKKLRRHKMIAAATSQYTQAHLNSGASTQQ